MKFSLLILSIIFLTSCNGENSIENSDFVSKREFDTITSFGFGSTEVWFNTGRKDFIGLKFNYDSTSVSDFYLFRYPNNYNYPSYKGKVKNNQIIMWGEGFDIYGRLISRYEFFIFDSISYLNQHIVLHPIYKDTSWENSTYCFYKIDTINQSDTTFYIYLNSSYKRKFLMRLKKTSENEYQANGQEFYHDDKWPLTIRSKGEDTIYFRSIYLPNPNDTTFEQTMFITIPNPLNIP
jgi:hypothetical protein